MIIDGTYFNEDNIFSMKILHYNRTIDNSIYYTNDDNTLLLYNDILYDVNGVVTSIKNDAIDFIYENSKSNHLLNKETIGMVLRRYGNRDSSHRYSDNDEDEKFRRIMDIYDSFISNIKNKHKLNISFKLEIHEFNINIVSSSGYVETLPILNIKQNINLSNLTSDNIKDIINFNPETTIEQLQKKYFKTSKKQLFN